MNRWLPLTALALAQFVMVLDQAVMNVSISKLVEDFETTVTTIQGVITLYSLVMAMFMLVGAKIALEPTTHLATVAAAIDNAEAAVRAAVPEARIIYIEPDLDRSIAR